MKKSKIFAGILILLIFGAFTYCIVTYNVAPIGPENSSVGLSKVNSYIHELTGVNMFWYKVTDYMGYGAIGIAAIFALAGLIQLIKRRSLFKVDREIISLGVLFAVVIALYVGFEKFIINYRPIIMPGAEHVEASYPSSHTVLIITVLGATSIILRNYMKEGFFRSFLTIILNLGILVAIGGRLYCGVHWFTDIVGGVLLSWGLLKIFAGVIYRRQGYDAVTAETGRDGYTPKH